MNYKDEDERFSFLLRGKSSTNLTKKKKKMVELSIYDSKFNINFRFVNLSI